MLLILIPVAWLALVALFVALCRMAASADRAPSPSVGAYPPALRYGLAVWEGSPAFALQRRPLAHRRPLHGRRPAARNRRLTAHGVR